MDDLCLIMVSFLGLWVGCFISCRLVIVVLWLNLVGRMLLCRVFRICSFSIGVFLLRLVLMIISVLVCVMLVRVVVGVVSCIGWCG